MVLPGEYLRTQREARGITLEEVSRVTKISVKALRSLETDDYESLPPPTFVKGFIRSYCRYIGAEDEDAVLRYEEYLNEKAEQEDVQKKIQEKGNAEKEAAWDHKRPAVIIAVIVLVVISFIIVLYLFSGSPRHEKEGVEVKTGIREKAAEVARKEPEISKTPEDLEVAAKMGFESATMPPPARNVLEMKARNMTWMKVEIDDKEPFEVLLKKGESVRWEADDGFSLLIGNAGGVDAVLNGKPVGTLGEDGQVRRIKLPPERK